MQLKHNKPVFLILTIIVLILTGCATAPAVQRITLWRDPDYTGTKTATAPAAAQQTAPKTVSKADQNVPIDRDAVYENQLAELKKLYNTKGFAVPPVATVMNFNSQGLSDMDAQFISDYLSSALYNTKSFRIIDRNQRETLLQELSFSMSGCSDESCQLEAGRLLSADKIIVGNLGKISTRFIMDIRMIDVTSGETVSVSNNIYNDMDALIDDCRFIAVNLTEEFLLNN